MKVAIAQMQHKRSKAANIDTASAAIREAAGQGARIVCLPELFNTIYFCVNEDPAFFDLAETIPGPTTEALAPVARETGTFIIAPIYEQDAKVRGVRYNTAAVIGPDGSVLGIYRKHSIPNVRTDTTSANEKFYFRPGNAGFPVFDTGEGVRFGIIICYDRHYPEHARCVALNGADVLFVPVTTWGMSQPVFELELRAHALFNGFYVAGVNRVGCDEGEEQHFFGESLIVDPGGNVVASAGGAAPGLAYCDVDPARVAAQRDAWGIFRDRRPDAYAGLVAL